jgi:hypothetical protein
VQEERPAAARRPRRRPPHGRGDDEDT